MNGLEENRSGISDETEVRISHFIPSVELKGSRSEKLRTLDTLIVYLEQLRGTLAGNTTVARGKYESPRLYIAQPAWPWFAAGALASAALVLLLLVAKGCA